MTKQEIDDQKKRALREKFEKHVNQLPLWDLFQIYFYIKWFTFREKLSRLSWTWLVFQLGLDQTKSRKHTSGFLMNRKKLILRNSGWAFLVGGILALYTSLTMFMEMLYPLWLAVRNMLIICSLLLAAFVGYQYRLFAIPFKWMLLAVVLFLAVIMGLYLGSYAITTTFLADRMVWIPFFYDDYNYHGFRSVTEYLNHEDNYRELLQLQVFSFSLSSVMYFAAGSVGYGIKAILDRTRRTSGMAAAGN
jgi:hypothetical protein